MRKRLGMLLTGIVAGGRLFAMDLEDASKVVAEQGLLGITFLLLAVGMGLLALVFNYRNRYRGKKSLLRYALSNRIVQLLLGSTALVMAVNLAFSDRKHDNIYDELEFARNHKMHRKGTLLYLQLLERFPFSAEYHHGYITAYYAADDWQEPGWDPDNNDPQVVHPLVYYNRMIKFAPAQFRTLGMLGKGITLYHEERFSFAEQVLKEIDSETMPYRNLYLGRISRLQGLPLAAEVYFRMEIGQKGAVRLAAQELALLIQRYQGDDIAKLREVVEDSLIGRYVPPEVGRNLYVREGDLGSYARVVFLSLSRRVNLIGFLAALAGVVFWASFLRRVDPARGYHPAIMTAVIAAGSLFCFLAMPAYDYLEFVLGFHETGLVWQDFLFTWFGIGLVEELVKFIPLLLIWKSTRLIRTPLDFIVYASLTGLGFAFIENFLVYFTEGSETIIHTRLLVTILMHMFGSAVVAYGIVLAKFRYKRGLIPITLAAFLLATLFHGLFDFFLISQAAAPFIFMSFVFFLYATFQYGAFLNNALNNNPDFNPRAVGDPHKLALFVLTGLIALLMIEFVSVGYLYGAAVATGELFQNLALGSFLIFFLVLNLSNIDVVKGEWFWVRPWNFKTHRNYNQPIGRKLQLRPANPNSVLNGMLPANGEIVARVRIKDDSRYYVFKFDNTVQLLGHPILHVVMRASDPEDVIEPGFQMQVALIAFRNEDALRNAKQNMRDFKLLDKAIVV